MTVVELCVVKLEPHIGNALILVSKSNAQLKQLVSQISTKEVVCVHMDLLEIKSLVALQISTLMVLILEQGEADAFQLIALLYHVD
jgi:hypothetical protein